MSRARPLAAAADPPPGGSAAARALIERQMAMLARLAEIGMEIAEATGRRAVAAAEGGEAGAPDPALGFARAARAVRLTIALQARLSGELSALDRGEVLARAAEARVRRDRAHRLVERAIEAGSDDEDEIERLSSDAWECLRDRDDEELATRPLAEVVARICAELGLPASWGAETFGTADDAVPVELAGRSGSPPGQGRGGQGRSPPGEAPGKPGWAPPDRGALGPPSTLRAGPPEGEDVREEEGEDPSAWALRPSPPGRRPRLACAS